MTALDPDPRLEARRPGLWRYLRFLGCDETLAEDLLQETFLEALKRPAEFPERSAAYLRTVARNLFLKSRRREPAVRLDDLPALEEAWSRFESGDGGDSFLEALRACLDGVGQRDRRALDLKYRTGAGLEEIGRELDLAPEGVKTLLRRIKESLRACVEGKRHE